ncbi:hypothetical protein L9F63_024974, partial [Diploptera punctata]
VEGVPTRPPQILFQICAYIHIKSCSVTHRYAEQLGNKRALSSGVEEVSVKSELLTRRNKRWSSFIQHHT